MPDLLIRDLSIDVLTALEKKAASLGLSRVEYVRRALLQEAGLVSDSCTENHLVGLLTLLPDLADKEIMKSAWQ